MAYARSVLAAVSHPSALQPAAFFLPTLAGNLAAMYHRPRRFHRADVLYLHPFGHELYNSRPIMAWLWRRLAERGIGVLSLDLAGCGDSDGDFSDARWEMWREGAAAGAEWLMQVSGRRLHVCGLRLGAALALDVASHSRRVFENIVLLQPVVDGTHMMTQFLRLRVAFSGMRETPDRRENTQDLRSRLAAGEFLEVAGYTLAPDLVAAIDRIDLTRAAAPAESRTIWIETQRTTGGAASLQREFHSVAVKPYWLHTRGEAPEYEALAGVLERVFEGELT